MIRSQRVSGTTVLGAPPAALRTLAALFILGSCVYGIGVYAFTQLMEPIVIERNWDRETLGVGVAAFWLSAPVSLIAGAWVARFGTRRILLIGGAIEAAALLAIVVADAPWQLFALRFLMGAGKAAIAVAIVVTLSGLYKARSSAAIAIALSGWHFGGIWSVPLTNWLLQSGHGWRPTVVAESVVLIVVVLGATYAIPPPIMIEAEVVRYDAASARSISTRPNRLPMFFSGCVVFYLAYGSLLAHLTPFLLDGGVPPGRVAIAVASLSTMAMAGALLSGALTQWIRPSVLGGWIFATLCVIGASLTLYVPGERLLAITSISCALGLVIGAGDPCFLEFIRQAVNADSYARVFTRWYFTGLACLFSGPYITGFIYDRVGSYRVVFGAIAVFAAIGGLLYVTNARMLPISKHRPGGSTR